MPAASNILPFDKSYAAQQASSRDRSRSTRETQEDGPAFSDSLDQARRNEAEPKRETGNAAGRDKTDAPTSETQPEAGRSGETGGSEGKRDSAA